jgi:hypothetical protein
MTRNTYIATLALGGAIQTVINYLFYLQRLSYMTQSEAFQLSLGIYFVCLIISFLAITYVYFMGKHD